MKKETFSIKVPSTSNNKRVDKYIHQALKQMSRTKVQSLIYGNHVKINNLIINDASRKVKTDDKIFINFPEPKETLIKPYKIPLNILYDDEDIIIINKAPGVVVHPGAGNYEKTIVINCTCVILCYFSSISNVFNAFC